VTDREHWDEAAALWQAGASQCLWRRHSDAVNSALIERWLPVKLGRVLKTDLWDEAVGEGLYPLLAGRSQEVLGIDVSQAVVAAALERHPGLRGQVGDVRSLDLENASFDAVVSNSTLDHFGERAEIERALVELRRVLRPGGDLLLTLDNPLNPLLALTRAIVRSPLRRTWFRHARGSARLGFNPYYAGATIGSRGLRQLLPSLGFELLEQGAIVHVPRPLAVATGQLLERHAKPAAQERFLGTLAAFERLSALPTRYFSGYFVAVHARAV
jgi:SAM-dependent methyltransferase